MGRPRKTVAPAKKWQYQVGTTPHTVTAYERERPGRESVVTIRWWPAGAKRYQTISTGIVLLDAQGRIDPERVAAVQAATRDAYNALLAGRTPGEASPATVEDKKRSLTLAAGFDLAFALPDPQLGIIGGMYARRDDHYVEMLRAKKYVLHVLSAPHLTWAAIEPMHYMALWRGLVARYQTEGIGGPVAAQRCGVIMAQTARWLSDNKLIPKGDGAPEAKWQYTLAEEWRKATGQVEESEPPRHTEEELGRLFVAALERKGDPRCRTAFILAAEARLGQAVRAQRSWLDLGEVGIHKLGRFVIPRYGKKRGVTIDITPEMREVVDYEMTRGYLFLLESACKAGRIPGYSLFPGGKLRAGVARVDVLTPLGDRALIDMFHHLERRAGVAIVPGRGWNGVRRLSTELAQDVEGDERGLNELSGHASSDTRMAVYQQKRRDKNIATASGARVALRAGAVAAATAAGPAQFPPDGAGQRAYEQMQADKRQRRRDLHAAVAAQKKLDTAGQPRRYRGKGKPKDAPSAEFEAMHESTMASIATDVVRLKGAVPAGD